ncbi:MAG TPA: phosphatidate cytidylyltransferase [Candidatus Onthovivens sp.]|nr:phosphatidate cytidylyltransferase [Candidatus Onthovivens sp.]
MERKNESEKNQLHEKYLNSLNDNAKKSMKSRVLTGFFVILVSIPCAIIGDYLFFALIAVLAIIATHEICKVPQSIEKKFNKFVYIFAYILVLSLLFWVLLKNNLNNYFDIQSGVVPGPFLFSLSNDFKAISISVGSFMICIIFFFLMSFIDESFKLKDAFFLTTMLFVIALGLQGLLFLRYAAFAYANSGAGINSIQTPADFRFFQSAGLIIFLLIGTFLSDTGAYFIGVLFGKHKLCPKISPKKTWEGFIGGFFFSVAASLLFAFLMDYFKYPILEGVLDIAHWYNVLIASLMMPLIGTIGDLLFSSIKRTYLIKDFGTILKDHGGILDRLDSLLLNSVCLSLLVTIFANNWNFTI